MSTDALLDAVAVLEAQAWDRAPDRGQVLRGALALDTLVRNGTADRDLLDAAAGLTMLAEGGALDLDAAGRTRALELAEAVRRAAGAGGA